METVIKRDDGAVIWDIFQIQKDLKEQGGISVEMVPSTSATPCVSGLVGVFPGGDRFFVSWLYNAKLLISMETSSPHLQELVDAFSKVVEYSPFCKYCNFGGVITTYEWEKVDVAVAWKESLDRTHNNQLVSGLPNHEASILVESLLLSIPIAPFYGYYRINLFARTSWSEVSRFEAILPPKTYKFLSHFACN